MCNASQIFIFTEIFVILNAPRISSTILKILPVFKFVDNCSTQIIQAIFVYNAIPLAVPVTDQINV